MPTPISSVDAYIAAHPAPGTVKTPTSNPTAQTYTQGQTVNGGTVNFNGNTGAKLNPGESFTLPTLPTVPIPSSTPASVPVVTSNLAQKDYDAKLANFNALTEAVKNQKSVFAQNVAQQAADSARLEVQDSERKLKQQQVGIQQQQANTAQADSEANRQALSLTGVKFSGPVNVGQVDQSGLTPSPGVPAVQDPNAVQGSLDNAIDQKIGGLNDILGARDQITQQSNQALQSLLQGTIPLSAPQQALITSLQSQLVQNENDQKQANASYEGTVAQAQMRAGGEYTPEQMAGAIHSAVTLGVQKVQNLDNSAAKTIADLEQSFQKDNYDIINKQFDNLTKTLDQKADAIKDTYDTVSKALQDQRDFNYKQNQDNFSNKLEVAKFNEVVKNNALDEKYRQAQLSLEYAKLKQAADDKNLETSPAELLAYAQQFSATGQIPTGLPKGTFGIVSQAARTLPKPAGTLVSRDTGVKSSTLSPAQEDGITALRDLPQKMDRMEELLKSGDVNTGLFWGAIGSKILPTQPEQEFATLRSEVTDLLARARTGATLNPQEITFYENKLPSRYADMFMLGKDPVVQTEELKKSLQGKLDRTLETQGLSIYGYSKVNLGGKQYTVGDIVQEGDKQYRILPDGSATPLN